MKTFIFLLLIIQRLVIPAVQNPPMISVEKTEFSSPKEWVENQNKILPSNQKMKIVKTEILGGITILTLSVSHDLTDDNGYTIYKNGLITLFIKNRLLYIFSPPIDDFKGK